MFLFPHALHSSRTTPCLYALPRLRDARICRMVRLKPFRIVLELLNHRNQIKSLASFLNPAFFLFVN